MKIEMKIKRTTPAAKVPRYHSEKASGMDLHVVLSRQVMIKPRGIRTFGTGIAIELPSGYEGQVRSRSGLACKQGLAVINSPGTIDADYRGEIKVTLINHGNSIAIVSPGDRVAQLVIAPVTQVDIIEADLLSDTERGDGGYGSTGA